MAKRVNVLGAYCEVDVSSFMGGEPHMVYLTWECMLSFPGYVLGYGGVSRLYPYWPWKQFAQYRIVVGGGYGARVLIEVTPLQRKVVAPLLCREHALLNWRGG